MRRKRPNVTLTVLSEIPASLFFTALLTYWLMGITYVRVKAKKLSEQRNPSLYDIVGYPSLPRTFILVLILCSFVTVQTLLHFRYLITETNRAVFSSFRHFETSEDVSKDALTIVLIIANALFLLFYMVLFIAEAIRSYLAYRRL